MYFNLAGVIVKRSDWSKYNAGKGSEKLSFARAAKDKSSDIFVKSDELLTANNSQPDANEGTAPLANQSEPVTSEEIKLIRRPLSSCWQQPAGMRADEDLRVDLLIELDKIGGVIEVEAEDSDRYSLDKAFKSFANAAVRAVHDCQSLPMPAEKYDQ